METNEPLHIYPIKIIAPCRHYPPAFGDFLASIALELSGVAWLNISLGNIMKSVYFHALIGETMRNVEGPIFLLKPMVANSYLWKNRVRIGLWPI